MSPTSTGLVHILSSVIPKVRDVPHGTDLSAGTRSKQQRGAQRLATYVDNARAVVTKAEKNLYFELAAHPDVRTTGGAFNFTVMSSRFNAAVFTQVHTLDSTFRIALFHNHVCKKSMHWQLQNLTYMEVSTVKTTHFFMQAQQSPERLLVPEEVLHWKTPQLLQKFKEELMEQANHKRGC